MSKKNKNKLNLKNYKTTKHYKAGKDAAYNYPEWAKDYHAVWDVESGEVDVNPRMYTPGVYIDADLQDGDMMMTNEGTSYQVDGEWVESHADETLAQILWDEGGSWDELSKLAEQAPSGRDILEAGIDIIKMLLEKNIAYSNSAMDPLNILSDASPEDQIKMHIDNKLTRLKYQKEFQNEDSLKDLAGYVILLMVLKTGRN